MDELLEVYLNMKRDPSKDEDFKKYKKAIVNLAKP